MGKGHSQQTQEIIAALETNANLGLTKEQAAERLAIYGPNKRITQKPIRFLDILREEITEPMILLLITVGVLYSIWGEFPDTLTIISIIIVLVLVEVWKRIPSQTFNRSTKTLQRLKR